MVKKNISLMFGLLLVIGIIVFPAVSQAGQGSENFIFINYIGREITLDLDDVTYIVPGTNVTPTGGRLALQLAAGQHKYAANAPGVPTGSAGEFTIIPGQVVAKAAHLDKTPYVVDRNGIVLAKPEDYVNVFTVDPLAEAVLPAAVTDTWQPAAAKPGQGSLVWINTYNNELTLDLAGQLYKVPPKANAMPGRLQVDLMPGLYRYTVSVPYASLNGEVTVTAGQVTGLSLTADVAPLKEYGIGDKYNPVPEITLHLAPTDLPQTQPDIAPAVLPVTGGEPAPVKPLGVVVKNYGGDTLVFTINNQTYTMANNAAQTLDLPPGHYTYTASLPFVAATGAVDVVAGQGVELSMVLDVNKDVLQVYQ